MLLPTKVTWKYAAVLLERLISPEKYLWRIKRVFIAKFELQLELFAFVQSARRPFHVNSPSGTIILFCNALIQRLHMVLTVKCFAQPVRHLLKRPEEGP